MENIKFIRTIMSYGKKTGRPMGDCMYYDLGGQRLAKACVTGGKPGVSIPTAGESHGVKVDIISKTTGIIDSCYFPFQNYFKPVQCSPCAPTWYQCIDHGKWRFCEKENVLPTEDDYKNLAGAIKEYIEYFKEV